MDHIPDVAMVPGNKCADVPNGWKTVRMVRSRRTSAIATRPIQCRRATNDNIAELVNNTERLPLQPAWQIRLHQAALEHVIIMPADHSISLGMLDTGKRYYDAHAVTDKKAKQNSQEADIHMP
eukprot:3379450-Heterocapsa_arctica.AAC.1